MAPRIYRPLWVIAMAISSGSTAYAMYIDGTSTWVIRRDRNC